MALPILLDCDPGHDDAIAIVLALASPELDVKAITSSAGNQTPEKTLRNVLRMLTLLNRTDIPVIFYFQNLPSCLIITCFKGSKGNMKSVECKLGKIIETAPCSKFFIISIFNEVIMRIRLEGFACLLNPAIKTGICQHCFLQE